METDTCRRELEIEVPAEDVQKEVERVTAHFQRRARVPGFRPGKTPTGVVRQRFREEIREEVLNHLVPEHFHRRVREEKLDPVSTPHLEDVRLEMEGNEPLRFKAVFEVLPSFELQEYIGLDLEAEEPDIAEQEVEAALKQLQERESTFAAVEDRPLEDGDFAVVSLRGRTVEAPGQKPREVKVDDLVAEIGGAGTLPPFSENLRGAAPGEERRFSVDYAADYHDHALAGRTLACTAKVNAIKKKEVPEVNDELARDLGHDSVEELRVRVRADLLEQKKHQAEREARERLLQRLVALHNFPVPQSLVDKQAQTRLDRLARQLAAQGVNPARMQVDWAKLRAQQREEARRDVQASLILDRIAERESIVVSGEEVRLDVERMVSQARARDAAALRARLTTEEATDRIKDRLRNEKTLDLIYRQARKGRSGSEIRP